MQNLAPFKIVTPNDGTRKTVVLDAFQILTEPKMLSLTSLIVITQRKCGRIKKKGRGFLFFTLMAPPFFFAARRWKM